MTGGQVRPLLVAGVAGGVGTSTLTRLLQALLRFPVYDLREYRGGEVDLLVTSNTVASASRIGAALALAPRPPVLVVMNTASGVIDGARPHLLNVEPHVTAVFGIDHRRQWLEMAAAPGAKLPPKAKAKDLITLIEGLPQAITDMYARPAVPPRPAAASQRAGAAQPAAPAHPTVAPIPPGRTPLTPRAGPLTTPQWHPQGGVPQAFGRGSQGG
ncbi:hypothetical protein SUDANB95_08015 (plasmid) [Actinosynnema sp. ALI-1.44]